MLRKGTGYGGVLEHAKRPILSLMRGMQPCYSGTFVCGVVGLLGRGFL